MNDFASDGKKRKLLALLIVLLILTIVIPIVFISLFLKEEGCGRYYYSYKEFHDTFDDLELMAGEVIFIKDTFSGIWYNETHHFTYMTFESMDANRTDPWGYDAGHPEDLTEDYHIGDKIIMKIEIKQQMDDSGYTSLVGHIKSIEHAD